MLFQPDAAFWWIYIQATLRMKDCYDSFFLLRETSLWFATRPVLLFIGVTRGGQRGHTPKFLENIVTLCLERRFSKQNSVIRPKSNILAPPKFLGWLRHCYCSTCCGTTINTAKVFVQGKLTRLRVFEISENCCSHSKIKGTCGRRQKYVEAALNVKWKGCKLRIQVYLNLNVVKSIVVRLC